jgi:hypothetical protein
MRVLIGCEFSGIVRDAFIAHGHDAVSCDLLPSERTGPHVQDDLFNHLADGWDLLIFHWPCTNMAISGARWFKLKRTEQDRDVEAFKQLMSCGVPRIAGENPISILSSRYRKPDQILQPWQFGHGETKATCLWLKNLPPLQPTNIVAGRTARVHREPPSLDRWRNRSRTYEGIAVAMAQQWGGLL